MMRDTGDVAEVPEDERLDHDGGEGSIAGEDPDDEELHERLAKQYLDPGRVVGEVRLQ